MFQLSAVLVLAGLATTAYALPAAPDFCPSFTPPIPVPSQPKKIIIDSDLLSFTDDVGALAIANTLQTMGYIDILGIISDVTSNYSLPAIDAINTWYCHPNVTFAQTNDLTDATREPTVNTNDKEYITELSDPQLFPQNFDRQKVEDPVQFYTRVLNAAEDNSTTILAIGFLTYLNDLYNSEGGYDLIKTKVKELIVQGGSCDTVTAYGAGFNLIYDLQSAQVITKWPTPVTFLPGYTDTGVEVGRAAFDTSESSPIRFVYETVNYTEKYNFGSADPLATYYAIFGLSDLFKHGNENGTGALQFAKDESSAVIATEYDASIWNYAIMPPAPQSFLILKDTPQNTGKRLDSIISCYGKNKPVCPTPY